MSAGAFGSPAAETVDWTGRIGRRGAVAMLAIILIWSPFPLGSAVNWGASVIALLVSLACFFAALYAFRNPDAFLSGLRLVAPSAIAALAVLSWVWIQTLSLPLDWTNPVWRMTGQLLHRDVPGSISINPWRTQEEFLKLLTAVGTFWTAFIVARDRATARFLLNIVIGAGTCYALYGFVLNMLGHHQITLIYGAKPREDWLTGPFMLHNSFATYCGLAGVAAVMRLSLEAANALQFRRGARLFALNLMNHLAGPGAPAAAAAVILIGAVLGSASRAGFAATVIALTVAGVVAAIRASGVRARFLAALGVVIVILAPCLFLLVSDTDLADRYAILLDAGTADTVRLAMWSAALNMIEVFPWKGTGLGTFQDAYPLFAQRVLPFVMDKAHGDFLEFAAGIGLPAAILWWAGWAYLAFLCLKGAVTRRRNTIYPLVGFGATVLVAVHSGVDFSLQIPAVAMSYAILLGIGVAQSQRSTQQ